MKPEKIRVLIVDDHPIVREGWTSIIRRQHDMDVVAEAASGEEAIELFRLNQPRITLLDLRLPGMSGIETTRGILQEFPGSKCIILSSYDGDEDIYQALQAGAKAYLLKDTSRQELLDAVRAVHAGQRYIPPTVSDRLINRLHSTELTSRERAVLERIVGGSSNKQIAWDLGVTEGTVKGHVNSILSKLGVGDRTHAAVTALRRGLVRLGWCA